VSFCAICTDATGPFVTRPIGRNDALVRICVSCDGDSPAADDGPDRGYEMRDGMSQHEMNRRLAATGASPVRFANPVELLRNATPGWILVRVQRYDGLGKSRDRRDALASLAGKPWFAELRFLGGDPKYFLFERPGKAPQPSANPLAAIEIFRVDGAA
jgi:hypothetical protein